MILRHGSTFILKTEFSNFSALRSNSIDLIDLAAISLDRQMYYQVSHFGHMSLELAFKAVYSKQYPQGEHPWGHLLSTIVAGKFNSSNSCLYNEIAAERRINRFYSRIKTVWDMQIPQLATTKLF